MVHHVLPQEIIYEILTRIPLIGVVRCRLVSKEWNLMTYKLSFMQSHCQRTKTISGFLVQTRLNGNSKSRFVAINNLNDDYKFSLKFLPVRVEIIAATKQGILLCRNYWSQMPEYYVCKPTTQEWHKIPNSITQYFSVACGMVVLRSNPLRYKIVLLSNYTYNMPSHLRCEVFDSETWAWKQLADILTDKFDKLETPISIGGRLYWLKGNHNDFEFSNDIGSKYSILEFREDTESWLTFNLPKSFTRYRRDYFDSIKLVDFRGHLALTCTGENEVLLWVKKNMNKKVWSKPLTINAKFGHRFAWFYGSEIAYLEGFHNDAYCSVFPFQSDFELVNVNDIGKKKRRRNS